MPVEMVHPDPQPQQEQPPITGADVPAAQPEASSLPAQEHALMDALPGISGDQTAQPEAPAAQPLVSEAPGVPVSEAPAVPAQEQQVVSEVPGVTNFPVSQPIPEAQPLITAVPNELGGQEVHAAVAADDEARKAAQMANPLGAGISNVSSQLPPQFMGSSGSTLPPAA